MKGARNVMHYREKYSEKYSLGKNKGGLIEMGAGLEGELRKNQSSRVFKGSIGRMRFKRKSWPGYCGRRNNRKKKKREGFAAKVHDGNIGGKGKGVGWWGRIETSRGRVGVEKKYLKERS